MLHAQYNETETKCITTTTTSKESWSVVSVACYLMALVLSFRYRCIF